jgi:hypothetical protein
MNNAKENIYSEIVTISLGLINIIIPNIKKIIGLIIDSKSDFDLNNLFFICPSIDTSILL